ncbi:hypothetical protein GQ602_007452 [Ophiocordyceps camponoti-floridani]|uniref:Uncharacterized protein n=1 Tax=Ophiocordyceps camponoti-floridani TaxID=2030778 RepID=A0A8H4Q0B4_9HYPO|nr:hypothetical protein GQ602_007452 [Ophiocordyceps camponoti-floridani]
MNRGPGQPRTRALPPPPKSPPPPPPAAAVSLSQPEGKSLSSAQAFDIFCDSDWESSPESLRRRSSHLDFSDDQDDYDYDYDYDDDDDDDDIDQDDDDQDDEEAEGLLLRDDAIVSINNKQPAPSTPQTNRKDDALLAARLEAETDRILAEQKKLDLARLRPS